MTKLIGAFIGAILLAFPAHAEVTTSDTGFMVIDEVRIPAQPAEVWAALIEPSRYWNPEHGYSGEAENYSLEPRAGGCFCEALPEGGSVEHMRVVLVQPERMLRLSGALGPLQSQGLAGALTWEIDAIGEGTRLRLTYVVGGYMPAFADVDIATAVNGVLREQMDRLVALFAESD